MKLNSFNEPVYTCPKCGKEEVYPLKWIYECNNCKAVFNSLPLLETYRTQPSCLNCKHGFMELEIVCKFYEGMPCANIPTITDVVNLEKYLQWANRNKVECNGVCDNYEHRN